VFVPGDDTWLHVRHHSTPGQKSNLPGAAGLTNLIPYAAR
jgi:hypothetical protein